MGVFEIIISATLGCLFIRWFSPVLLEKVRALRRVQTLPCQMWLETARRHMLLTPQARSTLVLKCPE